VSIVPFESDNIRLLRDKMPINEVRDLKDNEYNPGACTPLYDAIGFGIQSIRKEVGEADTVLVTIITDGYENASREYSGKAIAMIIDELKEKGWMFTYIGANQDAIKVASEMNISNALNFVQDEEGTRKMFEQERCCRMDFMSSVSNIMASMPVAAAIEQKKRMANDSTFFDK